MGGLSVGLPVREIPFVSSPGGTSDQSPTGPQPPDSRLDSVLNTLLERRARPDIGNLSTECAAFWRKDQFRREGSVPGSVLKKRRYTGI